MAERLQEKSSTKYVVIFFIMLNNFLMNGYNLTSWSLNLPGWAAQYEWSIGTQGLLAGIMSLGWLIVLFFAGFLYEKFEAKTLFAIGIALAGIGDLLRGFINEDPSSAIIAQLVLGIGMGISTPGVMKLIQSWFPKDMVYKANGFSFAGGAWGFVFGFNVTIPANNLLGSAQNVYIAVAIISFILAIAFFVAVPKRSEEEGSMNREYKIDVKSYTMGKRIKEVVTSKQILLCTACEFLTGASLLCFSGLGPIAFFNAKDIWGDISFAQIGFILSMTSVASGTVYFIGPHILSKLGIRKPAFIVALLLALVTFTASLYTGSVVLSVILVMFAGLGNGIGLSCNRVLTGEHRDVAGVKSGLVGSLISAARNGGQFVLPNIFASLIAIKGVSFAWAFLFMGIGLLGVIVLLFAEDTSPRAEAKRQRKLAEKNAQ